MLWKHQHDRDVMTLLNTMQLSSSLSFFRAGYESVDIIKIMQL
ncbi:hypothetical protein A1OE_1514 [Candidatus Endolissoclinum faulkneri L2]|uniref:Uncharacterized protein n=1 Tax=Candidatus Endolissoclinum faulkneri L2 TaxID=1193729 RepID=K7Z669_9PROT|nr:hypothetical protein A1OE_1514 [Candidatus Endolissoclinum faulkneri L2]